MPKSEISLFLRHYKRALSSGVSSSVFGWPSVAGAAIVSIIGLTEMIQEWTHPIVSAGLAFVIVFIVHAVFIAPYRAARMLRPFSIEVIAGYLETLYPAGQFPPQKAALLVTNRAYLPRTNCVMHIMNVVGDNTGIYIPRFITDFSIQPGDVKQLEFARWTSRHPPYENNKSIFLMGPSGSWLGGNNAELPIGPHVLSLRIGVPDGEDKYVNCRIWIEGDSFKATKL